MNIAYLLKLRWLKSVLDQMSFDYYDLVTPIIDKASKDLNSLNEAELDTVDRIYDEMRSSAYISENLIG